MVSRSRSTGTTTVDTSSPSAGSLPGWHELLASAFAERVGPEGTLRTLTSARNAWMALGRLMRFLHGQRPSPPFTPDGLTLADIKAFYWHRAAGNVYLGHADLRDVRGILLAGQIGHLLDTGVVDFLQQRLPGRNHLGGEPGYSNGELTRLVSAARADVAAIRDRIKAGEDLVARYKQDPDAVAAADRELAAALAIMSDTGAVPDMLGWGAVMLPKRINLASHLFLTFRDLAPLMVLLAAVTGRNGETLKELPAAHSVLDGRAVELEVIKRRRGPRKWFEKVTWEIGPPSRELHTPGGIYLLLLTLTARSRAVCGSPHLFCVWGNRHRDGERGTPEHSAVFSATLHGRDLALSKWAAERHDPVLADPAPTPARREGDEPAAEPDPVALKVSFNRIKTSVDVRRTKQLGGHLPSAARSNTMPVLFNSYLRSDPTMLDWAHEVMADAVSEAERAALDAHERALTAAGGALLVVAGPTEADRLEQAGLDPETARQAVDGQLDTAWTGCVDHDHHPATGSTCSSSFLDCFHCGNCLVTADHLPRLLGLLDALNTCRLRISETDWWNRYGPTWAAITRDILAKFSPQELEQAGHRKSADALLDLVEAPWEQP
ncbi:hypothetical protein GCM10029976_067170 [Kribbella albertanoniae]